MRKALRGLLLLGITFGLACALASRAAIAQEAAGPDDSPAAQSMEGQPDTDQPPEAPAEGPTTFDLLEPGRDHVRPVEPESVLTPLPVVEDWIPQDQGDGPAPTCGSGSWLNRGRWYVQEDLVYFSDNNRKRVILATDLATNKITLSTSGSLGFAPGTRFTLGHYLGRDYLNRDESIEFTFFGLNRWSQQRGVDAGLLVTKLDPAFNNPGFIDTSTQGYSYESDFNSYELNLRLNRRLGRDRMELTRDGWVRTCQPTGLPSFFVGLRVVTVNETFDYFSLPTAPAVNSGNYLVHTHNNMLGFQMGTDWFYQDCGWRVGAQAKAGPYVNFANQESLVTQTDTTPIPTRDESANRSGLAFLGEVDLMAAYQIRRNIALRASYDIMFINNIALAPEQVSFVVTDPPIVHPGGQPFYEAVSIGLEIVW